MKPLDSYKKSIKETVESYIENSKSYLAFIDLGIGIGIYNEEERSIREEERELFQQRIKKCKEFLESFEKCSTIKASDELVVSFNEKMEELDEIIRAKAKEFTLISSNFR